MKIVINEYHGGFNLSNEVFEELIKMGWTVTEDNEDNNADIFYYSESRYNEYSFNKYDDYDPKLRSHPDIVKVVEKLSRKANGIYASLKIIEIPDDVEWEIEEYDGAEWIAEKHRTWR